MLLLLLQFEVFDSCIYLYVFDSCMFRSFSILHSRLLILPSNLARCFSCSSILFAYSSLISFTLSARYLTLIYVEVTLLNHSLMLFGWEVDNMLDNMLKYPFLDFGSLNFQQTRSSINTFVINYFIHLLNNPLV